MHQSLCIVKILCLNNILQSLVSLNFFIREAECAVTLTPSVMTSVCPQEQLLLTCITTTDIHQWTIVDPNTGMTYTRTIAVPTTTEDRYTPLNVQSVVFNFAVISSVNTLPLISTLTADSVTSYLNASRIECLESDSENNEVVSINILGPNPLESVRVEYHLLDLNFGLNNVTVTLLFSQLNEFSSLVSYNITSPVQVEIQQKARTRFQLVIPYNIYINMSIIASLCGQLTDPTTVQLNYVNCGDPPVQQLGAEMNNSVKITGNIQDIPVMEGTTVSFSCHPDFVLSGPNSSTCAGNGEWEPDPREVECRLGANCGPPLTPSHGYVYPFEPTLEGAHVVFSCRKSFQESTSLVNLTSVCSDNGTWIPTSGEFCTKFSNSGISDVLVVCTISSSVTFVLTTIVCFITGGCVCIKLINYAKQLKGESKIVTANNPTLYEDVLPKGMLSNEQNFELKENVAYKNLQQQ